MSNSRLCASSLALLLALGACQRGSSSTATPQNTAPPQPPGGGDQQIVIGPGGGLGGTQVDVDGRPAWPPQGAGCERLVACCQQASSALSDIGMFCQMSVAMPPVDCARALNEVRSYIAERGAQTPAACGAPAQPAPPPTPPTPPAPPPPPPGSNVPVACATDADCPRLACGPCQSGEVVTRFITSINCFRNPCPGSTAVCRNRICVVR